MVAIYFPHPKPAVSVDESITKSHELDDKTVFILRALHACNEAKDSLFTCLGTAITYNRRCRNPARAWFDVMAEVAEAADSRDIRLADLKDKANAWGARLSCYHHFTQAGPGMAVLGAIALFREFTENVETPSTECSEGLSGELLCGCATCDRVTECQTNNKAHQEAFDALLRIRSDGKITEEELEEAMYSLGPPPKASDSLTKKSDDEKVYDVLNTLQLKLETLEALFDEQLKDEKTNDAMTLLQLKVENLERRLQEQSGDEEVALAITALRLTAESVDALVTEVRQGLATLHGVLRTVDKMGEWVTRLETQLEELESKFEEAVEVITQYLEKAIERSKLQDDARSEAEQGESAP